MRKEQNIEIVDNTQTLAEELVAGLTPAPEVAGASVKAEADDIQCPFCGARWIKKTRVEGVHECRACGSYYGPSFQKKMPKWTKKHPFIRAIAVLF